MATDSAAATHGLTSGWADPRRRAALLVARALRGLCLSPARPRGFRKPTLGTTGTPFTNTRGGIEEAPAQRVGPLCHMATPCATTCPAYHKTIRRQPQARAA